MTNAEKQALANAQVEAAKLAAPVESPKVDIAVNAVEVNFENAVTTTHRAVVSSVTPAETIKDLFIVTAQDDVTNVALQFNVNKALLKDVKKGDVVNVVLQHNKAFRTGYMDKQGTPVRHKKDHVAAKSIIRVERVLTMQDAINMKSHSLAAKLDSMFA